MISKEFPQNFNTERPLNYVDLVKEVGVQKRNVEHKAIAETLVKSKSYNRHTELHHKIQPAGTFGYLDLVLNNNNDTQKNREAQLELPFKPMHKKERNLPQTLTEKSKKYLDVFLLVLAHVQEKTDKQDVEIVFLRKVLYIWLFFITAHRT